MLTCVCVRVRVRVRVSVLSCPVLLCVLDREVNMPRPFTDRLNVEFQKAGVRGLSLFFATGDDGASGITCRYGNPKGEGKDGFNRPCDWYHQMACTFASEGPGDAAYITPITIDDDDHFDPEELLAM